MDENNYMQRTFCKQLGVIVVAPEDNKDEVNSHLFPLALTEEQQITIRNRPIKESKSTIAFQDIPSSEWTPARSEATLPRLGNFKILSIINSIINIIHIKSRWVETYTIKNPLDLDLASRLLDLGPFHY